MGSVERVLVLGIVVVIVAILGIAVWGETGDDAGPLANTATDGGVVAADGPARPALKPARKDAGAAAFDEIERWRRAREALHNQNRQQNAPALQKNIPLKNDGATTMPFAIKTAPALETPQPPRARKPVKPKGAVKHTVVSGDNLWKITYKYFGNSNIQEHLDAILAANPSLDADEFLQIGMQIVIPATAGGKAPALPATGATKAEFGGKLYEVQAGDTLSEISARLLGSSKRLDEIYELNRDRMTAPDKLQVGMTLRLPKR